jgi:hypothetical protein
MPEGTAKDRREGGKVRLLIKMRQDNELEMVSGTKEQRREGRPSPGWP